MPLQAYRRILDALNCCWVMNTAQNEAKAMKKEVFCSPTEIESLAEIADCLPSPGSFKSEFSRVVRASIVDGCAPNGD